MKKFMFLIIMLVVICATVLPANAGGGCRGRSYGYHGHNYYGHHGYYHSYGYSHHHRGNFGNDLAAAAIVGATARAANALVNGIFGGGAYYQAPTIVCQPIKVCYPVGYRSVHCEWQCR